LLHGFPEDAMSIEKTADAIAPQFQPRLKPRPARPGGFEDVLAASLDRARPSAQGTPVPVKAGNGSVGVFGNIDRSAGSTDLRTGPAEVHGTVDRQAPVALGAARVQGPGPAQVASATHGSKAQQASPHARAQTLSPPPSQFTPEEEASLRLWASTVNAPPRPHASPAKAPSLGGKPSAVAAAVAAGSASPADIAASLIGDRYVVGGESPRQGFDCSGLTSYVFSKAGAELPRNSREQFRQGQPVDRQDLRKGDLVFFGKKSVHHVGIYAGDGNFIHAATTAGQVHVSSLDDPAWSRLYAGARRVL
jgi:cell wall-associated NlpC family hydrolase